MDKERIVRLNEILREVSARNRPIDDLDEIPGWFAGTAEVVAECVNEVRTLFDEAYESGLINKGTYESGHGPCTHWDWTTTAHRRAIKKGLLLTNPMGEEEDGAMFEQPPNIITTPIESMLPTTLTALAEEPFQHCEAVFERQVRYVISHEGKPVAALVPLVDLEMVKDIQIQVDPCKWLEWIQNLRERLGWPAVTFNDKEE